MRHGATGRRSRNRGGNGGNNRRGGNNRMQVFDSNGPDVRIRGTAHQIHEKYVALSRDAQVSGDNILAEGYMQHAEHYQRIINSWQEQSEQAQENKQATENKQVPVKNNETSSPKQNDDLGLPSTILGDGPVAQKEKDVQMEDA